MSKTLTKGYSRKDYYNIRNLDVNYKLTVKFNSWKDGSVEVDLVDSNGLESNINIIDYNNKSLNNIKQNITKVLSSNTRDNQEVVLCKEMHTKLIKAVNFARNLDGNMTHDYDVVDCHSLIAITAFGTI